MMQNDVDRQKLTLLQQKRQPTTAELPQVQNKKKTPKNPKLDQAVVRHILCFTSVLTLKY